MTRLSPIAISAALTCLALPALAQESYTDVCTGQEICLPGYACKGDRLTFRFVYESDASGNATNTIVMQDGAPMTTATEASTQGFTWSNGAQVFAMLYLYNSAHGDDDPAEFMLMISGIDTAMSDTTLFSGTCEIVD